MKDKINDFDGILKKSEDQGQPFHSKFNFTKLNFEDSQVKLNKCYSSNSTIINTFQKLDFNDKTTTSMFLIYLRNFSILYFFYSFVALCYDL